jgi:hypothetical protein
MGRMPRGAISLVGGDVYANESQTTKKPGQAAVQCPLHRSCLTTVCMYSRLECRFYPT